MGPHRQPYPESGSSIDELFAEEPEPPPPDIPQLIFTEPADRDHLQFPEEVVTFVEERIPPRTPAVPLVERAYRPRWRGRDALAAGSFRLFTTAAGLTLGAVFLVVLLMPDSRRADEVDTVRVPRQVSLPRQDADQPPAPSPRPAIARDAEGPNPVLSRPPAKSVATRTVPSARTPLTSPPPTVRAQAVPARTSAPGTAVTRAEPPIQVAPPRQSPALDARRLDTDTAAVIGQPVAPPPADVPPVIARERGFVAREEPILPATPVATGTSGTVAADARGVERDKVRSVLSGYERAYSQLDAAGAARLYPAIDRKALSRAFSSLSSQQILFEDCRIQVLQSTAQATCAGTASWTPRVGGGSREQSRRWQFDLKQVAGDWQIGGVKVQ